MNKDLAEKIALAEALRVSNGALYVLRLCIREKTCDEAFLISLINDTLAEVEAVKKTYRSMAKNGRS